MRTQRNLGLLLVTLVLGCGGDFTTASPSEGGASAVDPGGLGGADESGGAETNGGALEVGGADGLGGDVGLGGASDSGGVPGAGGTTKDASGGVRVTGGAKATGGVFFSGGAKATGGVSATAGTKATGGFSAAAGKSASAGASVTGGTHTNAGATATGGTVAAAGTLATGGITATGGTTPTGGVAGAAGTIAPACATACSEGLECCGDICRNIDNDPKNCGSCGKICPSDKPLCLGRTCTAITCTAASCDAPNSCCGSACCSAGQLCCQVQAGGPSSGEPSCFDSQEGTCPRGCTSCVCADPETPIATPDGARRIADLRVGDLIYSVDRDQVVPVPIQAIKRRPANGHVVPKVTLSNGEVLRISQGHPTADHRTFGDLRVGSPLGDLTVVALEMVTYPHPFTYDIRPASDTGFYFAGGALIGSTIAPPAVELVCDEPLVSLLR